MEEDFIATLLGENDICTGIIGVVSAYEPGSQKDEEKREIFWNNVECLQSYAANVTLVL